MGDEHVVNHVCVKCDVTYGPGYENAKGDDPNAMKNTECTKKVTPKPHKDNGEWKADTNTIGVCAANQHVQSHKCVACPAGTTNAAGDDPHNFDTACVPTICKANEHVVKHECKPCPGDASTHEMNTAGDDASGPDTKCYE